MIVDRLRPGRCVAQESKNSRTVQYVSAGDENKKPDSEMEEDAT